MHILSGGGGRTCEDTGLSCGEKRCALRQRKMSGCGKTRPLWWQGTREPQRGAAAEGGRPPLWRRPKAASLVSCHNRGLVLSQQTSCLATAHIFSCRTRYPSRQDTICVSPSSFNMHHPSSCMHHTRCIMHHLLTTRKLPMFFGHNSTLVAPFGASMGAK